MNINQICEEIGEMLRSNNLWYEEVWPTSEENRICVDIRWGDWKHEHLRCDYLVDDYFKSHGMYSVKSNVITEEDGSDCYCASHYYTFIKVAI